MCGIVGIVTLGADEQPLAASIHRMATRLAHRGPDDEGYLLVGAEGVRAYGGDATPRSADAAGDGAGTASRPHVRQGYGTPARLAFGHRRLSILDLSLSGHQPMVYRGRYWIVYNGEVYNYVELREDLRRDGYAFVSTSDTEVIMAAYDRWGAACVERFNGMWAFAIYDAERRTLVLSRDRFGIKPLYVYRDAGRFIFASEIKAILAGDGVRVTPSVAYCRAFLAEGSREYVRHTAFTPVERFDRAGVLEVAVDDLATADLAPRRFWSVTPTTAPAAFDPQQARAYADRFYALLDDAVRLRLRADVRVGSALSGGLDSSSIVYLVNQQLRAAGRTDQQETFSTVYKSEGAQYCDESAYIDELADVFNLHTNQIEPRVEDVVAEHRKMVVAMENPPPLLHMGGWYTFKLAAERGIKVTLDGQGADELVGGYMIYLANHFLDLSLRRLWADARAFGALPGVVNKFMWTGIAGNLLRRVVGRRAMQALMGRLLRRVGAKNPDLHLMPLNAALQHSVETELMNLLQYGDGQSMAHSVESRLPFLDYRLVEFLAGMPAVYKLHLGWTKYVVRRAMDGKLPDRITWRKDKMGWPDPLEFWFRGTLKETLCRQVEASAFLRSLGVGQDIRQRVERGEPMYDLIRLYNLSVWHDTFFGPSGLAASAPTASTTRPALMDDGR